MDWPFSKSAENISKMSIFMVLAFRFPIETNLGGIELLCIYLYFLTRFFQLWIMAKVHLLRMLGHFLELLNQWQKCDLVRLYREICTNFLWGFSVQKKCIKWDSLMRKIFPFLLNQNQIWIWMKFSILVGNGNRREKAAAFPWMKKIQIPSPK